MGELHFAYNPDIEHPNLDAGEYEHRVL